MHRRGRSGQRLGTSLCHCALVMLTRLGELRHHVARVHVERDQRAQREPLALGQRAAHLRQAQREGGGA